MPSNDDLMLRRPHCQGQCLEAVGCLVWADAFTSGAPKRSVWDPYEQFLETQSTVVPIMYHTVVENGTSKMILFPMDRAKVEVMTKRSKVMWNIDWDSTGNLVDNGFLADKDEKKMSNQNTPLPFCKPLSFSRCVDTSGLGKTKIPAILQKVMHGTVYDKSD